MSVEHLTEFAGKAVVDWKAGDAVPDSATEIVRIHANVWDDGVEGSEILRRLLADPASRIVTGLVFGLQKEQTDNYSNDIVDALVKNFVHDPGFVLDFEEELRAMAPDCGLVGVFDAVAMAGDFSQGEDAGGLRLGAWGDAFDAGN